MSRIFRYLSGSAQRPAQWLTLRHPTLGLQLAGHLGAAAAVRPNSWRAPAANKLATLFGPMDAGRVRRIRREIGSLESRNEMLGQLLRQRGLEPLVPLVSTIHAEPLLRCRTEGAPLVVVSWHQGPLRAISLALRQLGLPALFALVVRSREPDGAGDLVRYARLSGGAQDAQFLARAHRALTDDVVVGLNLDCATSGETVSFLGRRIRFGRGAASLARLTGARVIPVTRRFQDFGWRMEVTFHEPIDTADLDPRSGIHFERALLSRAAQRFELEARRDPGSVRPGRVDWLLAEPRDGPADEVAAVDPPLSRRALRRLQRRRLRNRRQWEGNWASRQFDPPWVGRGVSPEIREAVASGWFAPGGAALDAGCGEGDVAAWLAQRGHSAVGADIAESAVARARRTHGERPGMLRYARVDLCERAPDGGPFRIVVDRGCFLQLAEDERRVYAARLTAACSSDARLLVFGRAFRDGIPFGNVDEIYRRCAEVMLPFGPYFDLERFAPTYLDRYHGGRADHRLPGMVFWLRRRQT